jgi:oligosaccharide translocation protein RFT1
MVCRFAMTFYSSHVAGIYGEVHNMGSLVVRMVFWPMESTAFRVFSISGSGSDQDQDSSYRSLLQNLHRLVLLVALIAFSFGPSYSFTAVHILLSHRWSSTEAPALLGFYSGVLVLLASNGILEAYSHARMSNAQLANGNAWLLLVTCVQVVLMWMAHAVGDDARFLLAIDSVAMLARIAYSLTFVHSQPGGVGGVMPWVPSPASIAALALAHVVTHISDRAMMARLLADDVAQRLPLPMIHHIMVGTIMLGAVMMVLVWTERQLIRNMRAAMKPKAD